ncbi:monothiol glutaredoxin-s9 [Quercus suber]|uniref:Monothiol glutaredoxin-s9 n=2 Tax=Quercus suber TaxID=58331 RepID=A0AAW0KX67_QUESU
MDRVRDLASKKAAVIFTKSSCFMCHSIKQLFYELGASPEIHELDQDANGREMEYALRGLGCTPSVPAVFIGGKYVGSAKDIISLHVDGTVKMDKVTRLATEKGVVIFSKSSCCLCYAVHILFQELGVNPMVHEIDQDPEGRDIEKALMRMGCNGPVPAVFIGGKLIGSTNEVMSLHLSGHLIPMLKPYQPLS